MRAGRSLGWLAAILGGLLAAGCAHDRPQPSAQGCNYRALPLKVGHSHPGFAPEPPAFEDEVAAALAAGPVGVEGAAREMLVLSGGSQHGAFGAGLFLGLPKTPRYDVVTGVSTGALLSTLVFLANEPVPGDRDYPRDLGEGVFKTGRSNLEDLAAAYSISQESALLKVSRSQVYGAVVRGSIGSLDPLRERLMGFVSEGTLREVRDAGAAGRKLYVGVADLDDGKGYAIDLTDLAGRLGAPGATPSDAASLRRCYVDALIASSSVPLAAYPVSLDIQPPGEAARRDLFVDGGARFGVFLRQLGDALAKRGTRANVTVVVNGKLYTGDWTEHGHRPDRWSTLTLIRRTVSLLTNQVYRFSVDAAETFPRHGGDLRMAFISNENLKTLDEDPDAHVYEGKSCDAWSDVDEQQQSPTEFHPRYMACLIDYGRARGARDPWNLERGRSP